MMSAGLNQIITMPYTCRFISLFLIAGLSFTTYVNAEQTLEYQWLTIGEPSGTQVLTIADDGQRTFTFEFNDRGRGPDTTTVVELNDRGIPVMFESTGVNYLKGEVNESFKVENGRARWQSSIEQGDQPFAGDRFYLPESWSPEYSAILARAILQDEDGKLPLLPSGEATIEKVLEQQVSTDNGSKTITLYAINGLRAMPDFIWLDEQLELFGFDAGWFGMTPAGLSGNIDLLKQHQEQQTGHYIQQFSAEISQPTDGLLAITNASVFDPEDGSVTHNSTVFILEGKITAVYTGSVVIPEDAKQIDAAGGFVMPALWDMHAHIQPDSYFNYLAQGVTNVRDMANNPGYILRAQHDIASGKVAAPNIHAMGFIDKKSEFAAPTGLLAESLEQALEHVDYYAQHGFRGIKLYSSIEPEWVVPMIQRAHDRGMTVLGHIPSGMSAEDAVQAGFDEITHINMLFLNFLGARDIDTRTPKRFTQVGELAETIDLQSPEVSEFIDVLAAGNIAHDPTMGIFLDMFYNQPGEMTSVFKPIADHLPALLRRGMISSEGFNAGNEQSYAAAGDAVKQMVKMLHEKGVQILPGTDNAFPGMALIRELAFYVDAGVPNAAVLRTATLDSARHLGLDQQYGRIAPNQKAHLLIVDGNPLENIDDLHRVRTVIKDHNIYDAAEILRRQGFTPFE